MTDINTSLEATAAEVFADDSQLDEVAADAPKKNAAPAEKMDSVPGERQDMGPAVVSPDAPTDPGEQATKKMAKAKKPGRDGQGEPSAASGKVESDKPLKAAAEEVEADEDTELTEDEYQ